MKKFILLGVFFLTASMFYSQTSDNFEQGYIDGYQLITNELPKKVPPNREFVQRNRTIGNFQSQSIQNVRSTERTSPNDNYQPKTPTDVAENEKNTEVDNYRLGYNVGKKDGRSEMKRRGPSADNRK